MSNSSKGSAAVPASFTLDDQWYASDSVTDREKIDVKGMAVPCRACTQIFRRVRYTFRYCAMCSRGYCEGEHLNFLSTPRGAIGRCVWCGPAIKSTP